MDNIYIYLVDLPDNVNEYVVPCCDGYTVYIDITLDEIQRIRALKHALTHIIYKNFDGSDVQEIEWVTHETIMD